MHYTLFRCCLCLATLALYPWPAASQQTQTVEVVATTVTNYYTAAASTTSLSPQYNNSLDFRTSVLNSTNFYRYEHNASYIYWNETLARYAQSYSEKCVWEHSHGRYGENLAQGFGNVTAAVEAWGNERKDYDFSNSNPTGFTEETGHFTQLVWKSTQATGCGWTDCDGKNNVSGVFLVCEYWPPGNVVGQNNYWFKQNVDAERKNGDDGFSELDATRGATGGVPSSTSASASPSATGKSSGSPSVEVDRGRLFAAVCVTAAAVLLGLGMS
ncbi:hypothetical protein A1O1_01569 [Capronia coronata CBS 617.96]|uniref:SCP domain-containing protein n=1 Tax=Capronia coronata CBS 617.96 TaxID=1182541 RepID=W9YVB3_9EURO|nr:uncharacterized protein A1O1_01569 [Capronia coronata CBS 617.96]EXJ96443.1 hypothetical protein A1O1_01569 [Capronia coronata CBS 617.96]